jgi:hypothetical protein
VIVGGDGEYGKDEGAEGLGIHYLLARSASCTILQVVQKAFEILAFTQRAEIGVVFQDRHILKFPGGHLVKKAQR